LYLDPELSNPGVYYPIPFDRADEPEPTEQTIGNRKNNVRSDRLTDDEPLPDPILRYVTDAQSDCGLDGMNLHRFSLYKNFSGIGPVHAEQCQSKFGSARA